MNNKFPLIVRRIKQPFIWTLFIALTLIYSNCSSAQTGTLAEPFPAPASNAALHYQRALLHLAKIDDNSIRPISKPIWQSLPQGTEAKLPAEITSMLYRSRFAIRSATTGSRTGNCNFGIDFNDSGVGTLLPHLKGMVKLGRLLTLRGALAESRGDWEEAAIIYFDSLRMGRHMTQQNTLLEALAGIEILRNNYFALSRWAVRCPSKPLVARSFGLLESMQSSLVVPPQIVSREASIMAFEFRRLRAAFPKGDWANMILESYGETLHGDPKIDRSRAVAACVKRGVPVETFKSLNAFTSYLDKVESTSVRFVEASAACVALPPPACFKRGQTLNRKYQKLLTLLSGDTLIDVSELGKIFAEHECELRLTRVALAVSTRKTENKFPNSLDEVASSFGGRIPANPYTQKPLDYQTQRERAGFSLWIGAHGTLPSAVFNSASPSSPK